MGPLQHCMRAPEVHGTIDMSKWGWASWGFAPGVIGWWTWNLSNTWGGSCPPGGGTGATEGSRDYYIPHEHQETPKPEEPTIEQFDALVPYSFVHYSDPPQWPILESWDPGKGLRPKACQPPTQVTPGKGFRHTSRRMGRYQIGGKNSSSFATWVPKSSVNGRCRTWWEDKLWPSRYPRPNKNRVASEIPHPAWPGWNEEISSLHCSRAAGTSGWWGKMK